LKILVITPGIYPDSHSGIPKLVYYMSKNFVKNGHEVSVLTRRYNIEHPENEEIEKIQYNRINIPKRGDYNHLFWPIVGAVRCKNYLLNNKNDKFDFIWIHSPWMIFFTNIKKIWPSAKIFFDLHFRPSEEILSNHRKTIINLFIGKLFDWVTIKGIKKSHSVIVHSNYVKKQAIKMIREKNKTINIINGGADSDLFLPCSNSEIKLLRKNNNIPNNREIFITVRGLKKRTGVEQLIKACYRLTQLKINYFLIIIGSGKIKNQLNNLINNLSLDKNIRIISNINEKELSDYYKASDVFVLPTQGGEGFGLATTEALASGLITFGTNNGATEEILKKYNKNWIIDGCSEEDIYKKLKDYYFNKDDYFLKKEIIKKITTENFSWKNLSLDLIKLVNTL